MLTDLHSLALRLAPELAAADLTLLRHQPQWPTIEGAEAYAIRGRVLHIRDYLRSIGQWAGQWGAIVVFIAEPSAALLIHELGHLLPAKPPIVDDVESRPGDSELQVAQYRQLANRKFDPAVEPWNGHDAKWLRRVLHLHQRASQLGVEVDLREVNAGGAAYALSPASYYLPELGAEPQYLSQKTFTEIEAEPMPPRFQKLFAQDVAQFYYDHTLEQYQ